MMRQRPSWLRPRAAAAGFTLVELMVVFAVAGLLLGVVPVALDRTVDAMRYQSTIREVVSDLRMLRSQAMIAGEDRRYEIDLDARAFVADRRTRQVPDSLNIDAIVGEVDPDNARRGVIRFYPDGSSTGGSILIVRKSSGSGVRLRVDWLLGRVTQEPVDLPG